MVCCYDRGWLLYYYSGVKPHLWLDWEINDPVKHHQISGRYEMTVTGWGLGGVNSHADILIMNVQHILIMNVQHILIMNVQHRGTRVHQARTWAGKQSFIENCNSWKIVSYFVLKNYIWLDFYFCCLCNSHQ